MFESAELDHAIDQATYDAAVPALREALLQAIARLLDSRRAAQSVGDTLHG